ncbi:MAG: OsmC family protein [bacterium]|nr:OsmC family protein [bacterium]
MKVTISRKNKAVLMEAVDKSGSSLRMDGSELMGGVNGGFRPMQLLLAGIGGCSSIDILDILKKQRQDVKDFSLTVEGEREDGVAPSVFTKIHLHFMLTGSLDPKKVKRALNLGVEKYCSVGVMLQKTAAITYSFEIIDE